MSLMRRLNAIQRLFEKELDNIAAHSRFLITGDALAKRLANSFPGLGIETTNICNANCTFCAYQYQERPTGVMAMDLYRRIIDQYCEIGGGGMGLTPTVGDPLVDPHIVERIRYARAKPEIANIDMNSNMIRLARFSPEALIDAGLTTLEVSTTGFDAEMYQRVYRSKMHDKVYKAIVAFARANNARGRPVNFRSAMRVDRPRDEVQSMERHKVIEDLVGPENIGINYFFDNWAGKIKAEDLTGTMALRGDGLRNRIRLNLRRPRISACTEMYSGPMVYWDGRVGACACRDVNASELIIGNVNERPLADIWFGAEVQKLRDEFLTSKVPNICRGCTHYNNLSHLLRKSSAEVLQKALARERPRTAAARR